MTDESRAPAKVLKLCKEREREFERSIDEGGTGTFGAACRAYLETNGSPRFLTPIMDKLGHIELKAITQQMIDKAAVEIYPNCTVQTRNRQFYTPFIAVWSYASMGQNAMCKPIKWGRPKGATVLQQVRKPVAYKDAVKFINACPDFSGKIMFFLFWTGCRPIEALNLECQDIDLKGQWAVLKETKTGEARGIPLHSSLLPMLKEEIKKGGRLFRSSTGEAYKDTRRLNKAGRIIQQGGGAFTSSLKGANKLGLGITPYTARHTVSTHLAKTATQYEKDAILGHARGMSGHYVHLPQEGLIKAIESLPNAEKLGCKFAGKVYNGCTTQKPRKKGDGGKA